MTPDGPEAVVRARAVSATAFALAAAAYGVVALALTMGFDGLIRDGLSVALLSPLVIALPAALVGALAGPRLARATESLEAAIVGMAVTVASALLYVAGGFVVLSAMALWDGNAEMWDDLSDVAQTLVLGGGFALVAGLVASPFGALAGYLAWRQIRHDTPPEPV